ncbi:hypothetical protein [Clostridium sp. IODB-O3]
MSAYLITYFISDTCGCGCGHSHDDNNTHPHTHEESSEDKIISKIKSLGSWGHVMLEAYVVKCSMSSDDILKELKAVANSGDLLFVTEVNAETASCSNEAVINWIAEV